MQDVFAIEVHSDQIQSTPRLVRNTGLDLPAALFGSSPPGENLCPYPGQMIGPHLCPLLQGTEVPGWDQDSPPFLLGIQLYPQIQGSL